MWGRQGSAFPSVLLYASWEGFGIYNIEMRVLDSAIITDIVGVICCLILFVVGEILEIIYSRKVNFDETYFDKERLKRDLWSVGCVILVGISWITNLGVLRLFTFYMPIMQSIIFFLANDFYGQHIESHSNMRWLNYSIYIVYILSNLLLPDGEFTDDCYAFFGFYGIKDANVVDSFIMIAGLLSIISVALSIIQMILVIIIRNRKIRLEAKRENRE